MSHLCHARQKFLVFDKKKSVFEGEFLCKMARLRVINVTIFWALCASHFGGLDKNFQAGFFREFKALTSAKARKPSLEGS